MCSLADETEEILGKSFMCSEAQDDHSSLCEQSFHMNPLITKLLI